ncbi:MAG: polyprenyl synthetase family protein [Microbacteriaceae bacterium]|nr:polyprenyl synthetase family protein [Microbacteriaceae bacterium]
MNSPITASLDLLSSTQEVEAELSKLLAQRTLRAAAYGTHFSELWNLASGRVLGGKMVRPRLLLGAFDALTSAQGGGPVFRDSAFRIAAAIELLHYSFLLHDDVIVGDLTRRGRPNLIGSILQSRELHSPKDLHWARTGGILMGDLMLSLTHQVFAREPLPEALRTQLLDLLDHTITESVVGEHLDVGLSDSVIPADLTTVLSMSRFKTATYTFELPLKAASILAGSSSRAEGPTGEIGRHLGVACQLQDDLLSTFGDPREHGKDAFSDLREGKETAIIAYARMTSAWPSIEPDFGNPELSDSAARHIQRLLSQCGAEQFIRSLIDDQLRACFNVMASPESRVPSQLARLISGIATSLEDRRS